jgi:hypothetical protein
MTLVNIIERGKSLLNAGAAEIAKPKAMGPE